MARPAYTFFGIVSTLRLRVTTQQQHHHKLVSDKTRVRKDIRTMAGANQRIIPLEEGWNDEIKAKVGRQALV
jgi:hypothetical protein